MFFLFEFHIKLPSWYIITYNKTFLITETPTVNLKDFLIAADGNCVYKQYDENILYVTLSVICYSFLWSVLSDKFSNNVQLTTDSWY